MNQSSKQIHNGKARLARKGRKKTTEKGTQNEAK